MAKTFMQLADEAMGQARSVSPEQALRELKDGPNVLLPPGSEHCPPPVASAMLFYRYSIMSISDQGTP